MKYFLLKLKLPNEIINEIYSFIDSISEIRENKSIFYKRLITSDYRYYCIDSEHRNLLFKQEERQLKILKNLNAYDKIEHLHYWNLKKLTLKYDIFLNNNKHKFLSYFKNE